MPQRIPVGVGAAFLTLLAFPASGATLLLRGKVVMQDGSAPGRSVLVERFCYGRGSSIVAANTQKTGQFLYNANVDALAADNCALRATLRGYESTIVRISHLNPWSDPNLPDIILREHDESLNAGNTLTTSDIYFASSSVPPNARQPWSNAIQAVGKSNFPLAERQLRIVVKEAPKMADGWRLFGDVLLRLNQPTEAVSAFQTAVNLDPKLTTARVGLLQAYLDLKQWPEAEAATASLIRDKADAQFPEIHTNRAIALYNMGNLEAAEAAAADAVQRDTKRRIPRAEMVLASIQEARADYAAAREHMQRYLEIDPRAADAADIRLRMENLGKNPSGSAPTPLIAINTAVEAAGEAWVPGGMKALARMANMTGEPAYQTFFEEYCRTIGREVSVGTTQGIPKFTHGVRTFLAAVSELIPLGEKREDTTVLRMSAASQEQRQQAKRVLELLGWTIEEKNGVIHVEPGYRPQDALLQTVAWALGIDQIAMQEALQSNAEFQFEIVSENARLVGGNVWNQILKQDAVPAGGLAAVFATDLRVGKACAGLNAMNAGTAAAIMSAIGLRDLAATHSELLYRYSDAFSITAGRADVPGGTAADSAWLKLVGANPTNPAGFFRALMQKDAGRLAAFYWTLAHADAAHQQYFTQSPDRAERFYRWFRDSPELQSGILMHRPGTQSEFLQNAPLDGAGNIHFPGAQSAWFAGPEIPLDHPLLPALVPVARLEQKRGAPLNEQTAALLARNHTHWAALHPYFEKLPALDQQDFLALSTFTESLLKRSPAERNAVLGEWYSLTDLLTRAVTAGSLDSQAAARVFRQTSLDLAGDNHAARAVSLLRECAGTGVLEDAVASNLLRLTADQHARFDRTLELLHAPPLAEAQPSEIPAALAALVYAAALDPGLLLLNEDSALLSRHRFSNPSGPAFAITLLHGSQDPNGTHFSGGFMGLEEAAKSLMRGAKAAPRAPIVARVSPPPPTAEPLIGDEGEEIDAPNFRSDSNMVEVYATVTDNRGRYIDDLSLAQFSLMDGKDPQSIVAFEPQTSDLSVVLLLDTTGSMVDTIASLKRAAIKLIDSLRPGDSVGVYAFSNEVLELAPFTTDRGIAKRAVMSTRALGDTALYDAIARAGHEMTGRSGKKVVIVFTDGRDTASMLGVDAAIERAKYAGIPVYTIAEGDAITNPDLLRQLTTISNATGGIPFQVKNPDDMEQVFEKVAEDLSHGYLLFFQAPSSEEHVWREIHVGITGQKDLRIRAREGYYP